MEIPRELIDQVRSGQVSLFLSSNVVRRLSKNSCALSDEALAEQLAAKFLGKKFVGRTIEEVMSLAASERGLKEVQGMISEFHRETTFSPPLDLVATFVWRAIFSTTITLAVERAFESRGDRAQQLIPFYKNGQQIDDRIAKRTSVAFYKLHGCISRSDDVVAPLIISPNQYLTNRSGRSLLFERLFEFACESPILFFADDLSDIHLRMIMLELAEYQQAMPLSYVFVPKVTPAEERYWGKRKFVCVKSKLETAFRQLDREIPANVRKLATRAGDTSSPHPITTRLAIRPNENISTALETFLSRDAEYVHSSIATEQIEPSAFYKGYFLGWPEIIHGLDVVRERLLDRVIEEVFLAEETDRQHQQELFVVKGHAGSGKSVMLHRIAWVAGVEYEALCLFIKRERRVDFERLAELYRLARCRLFVFVDSASLHVRDLCRVFTKSRNNGLPLTIITAERPNQWNDSCEELEPFLTKEYSIRYLSRREIDQLIVLLERHQSLGYLKGLPLESQRDELSKKAGRQLLVALHEATLGRHFADIIKDEYNSISSPEGQKLYLTVCILHRLGISVRAGLISRIHQLGFSHFKEKLARHLESIVFAREQHSSHDLYYESRHPHIAEIVVESILSDDKVRAQEYQRIIAALDIDYSTDRTALSKLTRARPLAQFFTSTSYVREIYKEAHRREPRSKHLLHQEAIYEMSSHGGDLDRATQLLAEAQRISGHDSRISHTVAELKLKKAKQAPRRLEKKKYRDEAYQEAMKLLNAPEKNGSHPFHTVLKVLLEKVKALMLRDEYNVDNEFDERVAEFERILKRGLSEFPRDSHLLDAESRFYSLFSQSEKSTAALVKAFSVDPASSYIALRLARVYRSSGKPQEAIRVLLECADSNPNEKELFALLAELSDDGTDSCRPVVKNYLRKSFTKGDRNRTSHFLFARLEFLDGNHQSATEFFQVLENSSAPYREKKKLRGHVKGKFRGRIVTRRPRFAFIEKDGDGGNVFLHPENLIETDWHHIRPGSRVEFSLAFTYLGATALNAKIES